MDQPNTVICEYEDQWQIIKTQKGLVIQESGDSDAPDEPVTEVYRLLPGEYEDKEVAELEQLVQNKGIAFDFCGELDDGSGYAFWAYKSDKITIVIRDGMLADVRIPKDMELQIEVLQIHENSPDYEQLREYEDKLYEDDTMRSADVTNVGF